MNIRELLTKNKETIQLLYGTALIILIPLLIISNTIFIINIYSESLDVALQRQALTVGRSIYSLVQYDLSDNEKIQYKIEELSKRNSSFLEISVLSPENENFKVTSSSIKENVGKISNSPYYTTAWMQPDNDGLATDSLKLSATFGDQSLFEDFSLNERFWLVAMPMKDDSGEKKAILSMKISSKIIDDLTEYNRNISTYLLIATVLISVLFLAISARLWDYALLYKKIKEVDQMKDEFISMASHELRTPLGAIKGYVSLILEGTFGEIKNNQLKESLDRIMSSTLRLNELVDDLLNVSRIEQGRLSVDNKNIKLEPIIEEIVAQLKISADEKKLSLEYMKEQKELPMVYADSDRLKQVLVNLIGNSIKYTEKGSVKITAKLVNSKIEIKIADTGIGMSAEEQKHLFEKFNRVKNEKTEKITGTGLGLWITKQIVELMKGTVLLESMKDVGTQVTVILNTAKEK